MPIKDIHLTLKITEEEWREFSECANIVCACIPHEYGKRYFESIRPFLIAHNNALKEFWEEEKGNDDNG